MTRNITILGLVQMLLVILGFFGLGIVMKINGYPGEESGIRWNPLALRLRQQGLLVLLVPIAWTVFAGISLSRQRFVFSQEAWAVLGIVCALTIAGLFIYACANPFYRPMLIF